MNRRSMSFACIAAAVMAILAIVPSRVQSQQQGFSFALIGDLGYFEEHEPWIDNVFADIG